MSALHAAAIVWPVLFVAVGLVIGRLLRRADRSDEPGTTEPAGTAPVETGALPPERTGVPVQPGDDGGPGTADAPEIPVPR